MSKRRLRNSIDEATQTSFSEHEEETHWTEEFFDTMSDRDSVHGSASAEASDEDGNAGFHEDGGGWHQHVRLSTGQLQP